MTLYIVAIGWMYVVLAMTVAEMLSPQGTVLGALITLVLYGLLPLGIVLYILGTPVRRRAQRRAASSAQAADDRGHASADAVAPEREEV